MPVLQTAPTIRDVAEMLSMTEKTVYRLAHKGGDSNADLDKDAESSEEEMDE